MIALVCSWNHQEGSACNYCTPYDVCMCLYLYGLSSVHAIRMCVCGGVNAVRLTKSHVGDLALYTSSGDKLEKESVKFVEETS